MAISFMFVCPTVPHWWFTHKMLLMHFSSSLSNPTYMLDLEERSMKGYSQRENIFPKGTEFPPFSPSMSPFSEMNTAQVVSPLGPGEEVGRKGFDYFRDADLHTSPTSMANLTEA